MHQYVELSNVYDEREAEEDELDDDIAERQLGARSSASASEATATAAAAATAAGTEDGAPAAGSNLDDPIPEDELGDAAAGALGQEGSLAAPTGGAAGASTRTGAGATHSVLQGVLPCTLRWSTLTHCMVIPTRSCSRRRSRSPAAATAARAPLRSGAFLRRAASLVGSEL